MSILEKPIDFGLGRFLLPWRPSYFGIANKAHSAQQGYAAFRIGAERRRRYRTCRREASYSMADHRRRRLFQWRVNSHGAMKAFCAWLIWRPPVSILDRRMKPAQWFHLSLEPLAIGCSHSMPAGLRSVGRLSLSGEFLYARKSLRSLILPVPGARTEIDALPHRFSNHVNQRLSSIFSPMPPFMPLIILHTRRLFHAAVGLDAIDGVRYGLLARRQAACRWRRRRYFDIIIAYWRRHSWREHLGIRALGARCAGGCRAAARDFLHFKCHFAVILKIWPSSHHRKAGAIRCLNIIMQEMPPFNYHKLS